MPETYRGWLIEENWLGQWEATHPDFDGEDDPRFVTANTKSGVMAEIETWIEENE